MDKKFSEFIANHHLLTVATVDDGQPWVFNCFYCYVEELNIFLFTTDDTTRHGQEMLNNERVAASISLETKTVGKIQGLQMTGVAVKPEEPLYKKYKKIYLKSYPFAVLMDTNLWIFKPKHMKLTDNRLGFGKKLIYECE